MDKGLIANITAALLAAVLIVLGGWTLWQDHQNLQGVIAWANAQIQQQQAQQRAMHPPSSEGEKK